VGVSVYEKEALRFEFRRGGDACICIRLFLLLLLNSLVLILLLPSGVDVDVETGTRDGEVDGVLST
jgi:hypothetical protein